MATLYPPSRGLLIILRQWWKRRRCPHADWPPLAPEPCRSCGKEWPR